MCYMPRAGVDVDTVTAPAVLPVSPVLSTLKRGCCSACQVSANG